MRPRLERLAGDLALIDTHYNGVDEAVGAYLLTGDRPALIETGPASVVDHLLDGVRAAGFDPNDLQALAVTHIHLDHAGAVGTLAHRFPNLHVYVHPLGAPHLADPSRLLASARRLYGDDLERLFGEVVPAPASRIRALDDGAEIDLGSRRLKVLHTPGHARHHLVYVDEAAGDVFTGDAAGVALPGTRYVRPPTPPPELDVPAWEASIARLRALRARRLLLTHFGAHAWADELLVQLQRRLQEVVRLVEDALEHGLDETAVEHRLRAAAEAEMGASRADSPRLFEYIMSTRQSALGLIRYVQTRR